MALQDCVPSLVRVVVAEMVVNQPFPLRTRIPSGQSWAFHIEAIKKKGGKKTKKFYIFPKDSLQKNQKLLKVHAKK